MLYGLSGILKSKTLVGRQDPDRRSRAACGRRVPEAVGLVIASRLTPHDLKGFWTSSYYFDPRDMTSDLIVGEIGCQ